MTYHQVINMPPDCCLTSCKYITFAMLWGLYPEVKFPKSPLFAVLVGLVLQCTVTVLLDFLMFSTSIELDSQSDLYFALGYQVRSKSCWQHLSLSFLYTTVLFCLGWCWLHHTLLLVLFECWCGADPLCRLPFFWDTLVQCAPTCHRSGRLFLFANIASSLVPTPASCLHLPHPAEGLHASRMRSTALGLLG